MNIEIVFHIIKPLIVTIIVETLIAIFLSTKRCKQIEYIRDIISINFFTNTIMNIIVNMFVFNWGLFISGNFGILLEKVLFLFEIAFEVLVVIVEFLLYKSCIDYEWIKFSLISINRNLSFFLFTIILNISSYFIYKIIF